MQSAQHASLKNHSQSKRLCSLNIRLGSKSAIVVLVYPLANTLLPEIHVPPSCWLTSGIHVISLPDCELGCVIANLLGRFPVFSGWCRGISVISDLKSSPTEHLTSQSRLEQTSIYWRLVLWYMYNVIHCTCMMYQMISLVLLSQYL